jgi:hypothetical protein
LLVLHLGADRDSSLPASLIVMTTLARYKARNSHLSRALTRHSAAPLVARRTRAVTEGTSAPLTGERTTPASDVGDGA